MHLCIHAPWRLAYRDLTALLKTSIECYRRGVISPDSDIANFKAYYELAARMSGAWVAFARTGDPNTSKLPHWPAFDDKDRATMVINNASKVVNDPLREQRLAMFQALNLT